jgi:predicted ArsR family transcriptional regulator
MTCPAILSLKEFRDTHRRAAIRQWLHDRFDRWLNQLEDRMQDPTPTLAELTQAVLTLRQEWKWAVVASHALSPHLSQARSRTRTCHH